MESYDYIVIGSGFGGSVSAFRLAEKGYSVLVLEEGRWFKDTDYPKTNNNLFKYFWMPKFLFTGFQRITFLKHAAILGAAGVGGGSINYANTLLRPPEGFYASSQFPRHIDWKGELEPFYSEAEKMLAPVVNTHETEMDRILKDTAEDFSAGATYYPENVAVYFGDPEETVPDPYYGGEGPDRTGCNNCAGCMIGCRYGAKNVLLKNYLYFAQKKGAKIEAERKVVDVIPDGEDYVVVAKRGTSPIGMKKYRYRAKGIIFSGGVIGNLRLLFSLKRKNRINISDALGKNVRTNSESLIGVRKNGKDYADGVAITSGMYLDETTHIEVVRYPKGANALSFITTLPTDKKEGTWRLLSLIGNILKHPLKLIKGINPVGWAKECIILLVMQTEDNCIRVTGKRTLSGGIKLKSKIEEGTTPVPVYIPGAYNFARKMAEKIGGTALSNIYEVLFGAPLTAHILGGCGIGKDESEGTIDENHRIFGYDNLFVNDASCIPANLGVNPALTITAMAERAISRIPVKEKVRVSP